MSFSPDLSKETDANNYKHLLQKLAQSEGFTLPEYKSIRYGKPHDATFFSTVEFEGDIFHGKAAKSKKQAELYVAKSVYTALMERRSKQTSGLNSPASFENESLGITPGSDLLATVNSKGKAKYGDTQDSTPSTQSNEKSKEIKGKSIRTAEDLKFSHGSDLLNNAGPKGLAKSDCVLVSTPATTHKGPSKESEDSRKSKNMESYLLCNRVRVFNIIPDIEFPKGTLLLPIREDKWADASLEYPIKIDF